jgi:D-alanine-D-alanine ligase-like ATP-grasp enzyme
MLSLSGSDWRPSGVLQFGALRPAFRCRTAGDDPCRMLATRALGAVAARGRAARELAVALELLRTIGFGPALRRHWDEAKLNRLRTNLSDAAYFKIWLDAAKELDADLEPLGSGFLRIRGANDAQTVVFGQAVMLDDFVTLRLAERKSLVHELLEEVSLPTADHLVFDADEAEKAVGFLERQASPCVVKPADGTGGGAGTTGNVHLQSELLRAALKASRWSRRLLIERQVPGLVYRLLFLDGELLDVVERGPPTVTGDGHSTIAQLISTENDRRVKQHSYVGSLLRPDLDTTLVLRESGYSLSSVLPAGTMVPVKTLTSQNGIGDNVTYRGRLSAQLVADTRRAAQIVGVRLAGVDVVTTDPTQPLQDTDGALIEVNGQPGLTHHYEVADRARATRVGVPILRKLLDLPA